MYKHALTCLHDGNQNWVRMKKQLLILLFSICNVFNSHAQNVNVSTAAQLNTALTNAKAGQTITLADGTYTKSGGFVIAAGIHGTATSPIKVVGSAKAIISSGSLNSGYGISMAGNNYWVFEGFSIYNSAKGMVIDNSHYNIIDKLKVTKTGSEGIHLRTYSSYNTVSNCYVDSTGSLAAQATSGFAEGIYVGSATSNWATYTNGNPDTSNYNTITYNTFGNAVVSENIDIKEGTTGGIVSYNQFNGKGCNGANGADSWIDVKGNNYTISCNSGINNYAGGDGFQTHIQLAGWGDYNTFLNNTLHVGGSGYGILITTSSSKGSATHNKVCSNNTVSNATAGLTNVSTSTCTGTCGVVTNITEPETMENTFGVSPNPFDQYIELSFSKPASKLELSDMNGKVVMQELLNNETRFTFTTRELSAGFYYIKITYLSGTSEIRKVMKM